MSFDIDMTCRVGARVVRLSCTSDAPLSALVGPSGAGKTTVLNCIAGLLKPDSGHIIVDGRTLFDASAGVNLRPEQRQSGYVFQDARLFPHMRVAGNLAYGQHRAAGAQCWLKQDEVVEFLGIGDLLTRWPANLSGGETRRVAIGRALLSAPRFLLLDEPFASLDEERGDTLMALVERIRDELKVPILLVSHDRGEVERLASRIVSLA